MSDKFGGAMAIGIAILASLVYLRSSPLRNAHSISKYVKLTYSISISPNPADAVTTAQHSWNRLVYETLVKFDDKMAVEPGLAKRWTFDPYGTEVKFTLRNGARFNDGSLVRTNDIVASLKYLIGTSANKSQFAAIESVSSDDSVVKIKLKRPNPLLIPMLASSVAVIFKKADPKVGSGPFIPKGLEGPCRLLDASTANPGGIRSLRLCETSESDGIAQLKSGVAQDMIDIFLNHDLSSEELGEAKSLQVESSYTWILALNLKNPLLKNPKFRHCLAENFDREDFVRRFVPTQKATNVLLPQLSKSFSKNGEKRDSAICQKVTKSIHKLKIEVPKEVEHAHEICSFLTHEISRLGTKTKCMIDEFSNIIYNLEHGRHEIALLAIGMEVPSPLYPFSFLTTTGPFNLTAVRNAKIEQYFDSARAERNSEQIAKLVEKMNQEILDDALVIPISSAGHRTLANKCLDLHLSPLGPAFVDYTKVQLIAGCQ